MSHFLFEAVLSYLPFFPLHASIYVLGMEP
jgi:hypothetical protein